ncbi:MAG: hypothetical protein C0393_04525 [Anaerolinea sp.]|nr:hypothetical protein [Anaerolinea sp.]
MYEPRLIKKVMTGTVGGVVLLTLVYLQLPHAEAINYPAMYLLAGVGALFGLFLRLLPEHFFSIARTPYDRAVASHLLASLLVYFSGGLQSPFFLIHLVPLSIDGVLHPLQDSLTMATMVSLMHIGTLYAAGDLDASLYWLGPLLFRLSLFYGLVFFTHFLAERVHQSRAEAVRRAEELSTLYEVGSALSTTLDLNRLLDLALEQVDVLTPFRYGLSIALFNPEKTKLTIAASRGLDAAAAAKYELRLDDLPPAFAGQMLTQKSPRIFPNVESESALLKALTLGRVASFFSFPLVAGEQVIGFLSFGSQTPRSLPEGEQRLFCTVANQIAVAIENARLYAKVQQLAITDALTSLYNRRGLFELGRREVERARRFNRPLAGTMFDLDHFKLVNDACGHATGDQVLAGLAARCRPELREVDLLGRYGGEEFVALLPETDLAGALQVAERLRHCVEQSAITTEPTNATPHGAITITISVGVAMLDKDCPTLEALIERADRALYAAKQAGRNRVAVFTGF